MTISKIPPEILTSIAMFLSKRELRQSSLVCKQWRQPFYEELWRTVRLYNEAAINAMLCLHSQNKYMTYGQYVRNLFISGETPVSRGNILVLQQLFPNTRHLDIALSYPETTDISINWSVWKSLTELAVDFQYYIDSSVMTSCSVILSHLSYLTTLGLVFGDTYTSRIGDFEAIHYYLPYLKSFSIKLKSVRVIEKDIKLINEAVPANNVWKLSITMDMQDLQWLYYFAVKYPNVREMTLYVIGERDYLKDCNLAVAKSRISSLPHVFPSLDKLTLDNSAHATLFPLAFYQCFYDKTLSIKEFIYQFYIMPNEERIVERTTREFMRVSSKTIESMTLSENDYMECSNPRDLTTLFTDCPRLVCLHFDNCGSCLKFDTIADCCPSLKELKLYRGGVYIGPEAIKSFKPHGLRILNLKEASIDPDTLKYISVRCVSLSHASFHRLVVFGTISADTGNLLIDMSNARLTELLIDGLFYRAPEAVGLWYPITKIDLMKLVRLTKPYPQTGERYEQTDQYSANHVSIYETETTWYNVFTCAYWSAPSDVYMLKQPEVDFIKEYFENYRDNMLPDKMQDICISKKNQYGIQYDVYPGRGYVTFMCGYAENSYINMEYRRSLDGFKWNSTKNMVEYLGKSFS
ncbi:hypothetical protein PHYBLDRAFT_181764 [Phycomyces blakesleeanus NRRL 1555(-)]|uniref:F-box domain-containing protein n=1 Tax=Phycomyces blakesleeanus (strain ATCC 8743b / DSM 1359 / FGSC 10004 / NBRC 33097 / NRRL 1555) TaxID=763407 RepID=A0A167MA54_PHYB8|nr:hypothetical protein PHYBLDRAFT_181764 [Phycomyces blakesleeanus NRRL 1555(-)]OAD72249.1 hypothetical protein PHYBLDRAFT_181764 [Phycomyces blakesleeanus NRRL 1555(-)]|eukprot:XP_018290289.1 hypothetical protein PHYBLDRAFT_181764 [Phycomyces blakesleeanus NRRL 1555(-)]